MEYEVTREDIMRNLTRRFAWDMCRHESMRTTLERLGLPPAGPDVHEGEHTDSHNRADCIAPLIPIILASADAATKVIATMFFEDEMDPKAVERLGQLTGSAIAASIANLFFTGLIQYDREGLNQNV